MTRRGQQARDAAEKTAIACALSRYLDAVERALLEQDVEVTSRRAATGPQFLTMLDVRTTPQPRPRPGAYTGQLAWREREGWSLGFGPVAAAAHRQRRYLHIEAIPPPDTVALFAAALLNGYSDVGWRHPPRYQDIRAESHPMDLSPPRSDAWSG